MLNKKAFSLTELMLLLMVVSLIVAASVPVITKKHFKMPSAAEHGSYICYYQNGKLYEKQYTSKFGASNAVTGKDGSTPVQNCVFNPPEKAAYFQVSAVGGGGGGGDSGFTGGNLHSGWTEYFPLEPFGITEASLVAKNIAPSDFTSYPGKLYTYAKGQPSGKGGDSNYVAYTKSCLRWEDGCDKWSTTYGEYCENTCDGDYSNWYNWSEGYRYWGCAGISDYTYTVTEPETRKGNCYQQRVRKTKNAGTSCSKQKVCKAYATESRTEYGCEDTRTGAVSWSSSPSSADACVSGNNSGFRPVSRTVTVKTGCAQEVEEEVCAGSGEQWETVEECETYTAFVTNTYTYDTGYTYNCGYYTNDCSQSCHTDYSESHSTCVSPYHRCVAGYEYESYDWQNGGLGGPARNGVACVSSTQINGGYGLTYSVSSQPDYINSGVDGQSLTPTGGGASGYPTSAATAADGLAQCSDGAFRNNCGSSGAARATATISGNGTSTVTAYSAYKAGKGASRTCGNGGYCNTPASNDAGSATDGAGWCGSGTKVSSVPSVTGYYLIHNYPSGNSTVANDSYWYRFSYDENYLSYGNPGDAGEYKSMVLRSFKNMDTTIRIGRGGTAGAQNSGASGSDGSPTSLGNLLVAQGGKGGEGGIITKNEVLEGYVASRYNQEKTCYNAASLTPAQQATCNSLKPYKYYRSTGRKEGGVPSIKGLTANLLNYVLPKVTDEIATLFNTFGYGGKGGGVTHRCWAGQFITEFEGRISSSSIYPAGGQYKDPNGNMKSYSSSNVLPSTCTSDYTIDKATDGKDGALMIKW